MTNSINDKENWFLLGLITFGLLIAVIDQLFNLRFTPIILLIMIGISTTALFYKLLGGLEGSFFGSPIFRLSGSGAFLFAFIYMINPILERQILPDKNSLFEPHISSWVAVDKDSFKPIDLTLNYMNYKYTQSDFGQFDASGPLYFNLTPGHLTVYKDQSHKVTLGKIETSKINELINEIVSLACERNEVFLNNIGLNEMTPTRSWFPFRIKPVTFDNNTTVYQVIDERDSVIIINEIQLRGSAIHTIMETPYLITIHGVNHKEEPYWVRFAVAKLEYR